MTKLAASPAMQAALAARPPIVQPPQLRKKAEVVRSATRPDRPKSAPRKGRKPKPPPVRSAEYLRYGRTLAVLQARFPAAFSWAAPLKIGIDKEIIAALGPEEMSRKTLRAFLYVWTRRPAYRDALARGERRINLDGSDAGPARMEELGGAELEAVQA